MNKQEGRKKEKDEPARRVVKFNQKDMEKSAHNNTQTEHVVNNDE
jgi:hypothetical protein